MHEPDIEEKTTNTRIGMNMKTELIQGAIFDMDGTLLDSMPVWEHASERYLQNKGIEVREKLSEILFSMSMQKGAEYVKENYHLTESTDEIVTGVNNIVYTAYEKEVQPKEGVREFLDKLQAEGIKMVVATSTDRPMVEAALKRTGLLSYFERIFTCTEIGKGKVEPDIYHAEYRKNCVSDILFSSGRRIYAYKRPGKICTASGMFCGSI